MWIILDSSLLMCKLDASKEFNCVNLLLLFKKCLPKVFICRNLQLATVIEIKMRLKNRILSTMFFLRLNPFSEYQSAYQIWYGNNLFDITEIHNTLL